MANDTKSCLDTLLKICVKAEDRGQKSLNSFNAPDLKVGFQNRI